jgi:threonine dehydratase
MSWLFREAKLVAEPSGAAALAALWTAPHSPRGARAPSGASVAVISGGNIAVADFIRLLKNVFTTEVTEVTE